MDIDDQLSGLCLRDDDEPPVYRSIGAEQHFLAATEYDTSSGFVGCQSVDASEPQMRCSLPGDWDWEEVEDAMLPQPAAQSLPPLQLAVSVTPHRMEGGEPLVCSLRQFHVLLAARRFVPATFTIGPMVLRAYRVW